MAIQFSEKQVKNRISFENPWWGTGEIDRYFSEMKRRTYFNLLYPLIKERSIKRAVVLMGPRRVGKTVLLYHSVDQLIKDGLNERHIAFFSIETPIYNGISLEELLHLFFEINDLSPQDETVVIFDEIQYLKDWERHLKSLVDSYHNVKFIVSGSAAAALKLKSQESGAGRFTEFILPPLTFFEFVELTGNSHHIQKMESLQGKIDDFSEVEISDMAKVNDLFIQYINFGGYPELSLSPVMQADPGRYIRNDIIDKVLMRDLPSLYGINDIQELNSLFTFLAYNSGNEISLDGIAQHSGVAKNTIKKYLIYLEAAFLIQIVHRVDENSQRFKRANRFKVYLTNPSLRAALFAPIASEDPFMGNMVETAIFSQWNHNPDTKPYYGRWKTGEIDVIFLGKGNQPPQCMEIKWSNRFAEKPNELKNIRYFAERNPIQSAYITTIDVFKVVMFKDVLYSFLPAALICYVTGRNILLNRVLFQQ